MKFAAILLMICSIYMFIHLPMVVGEFFDRWKGRGSYTFAALYGCLCGALFVVGAWIWG